MSSAAGSPRTTLALLAAAGLVAFLAYGAEWVVVTDAVPGLPVTVRTLSGRDLAPGAGYLPLLLLVAPLAVWATGGWARRVVGVVVVLAGLAVAWGAVSAAPPLLDAGRLAAGPNAVVQQSAWWLAAVAGGLVAAYAGVVVLVRGGCWPRMGARYERTERATGPARERSTWELLDAGVDPTDVPEPADSPGPTGSADAASQPSGTMAQDGRPERGSEP